MGGRGLPLTNPLLLLLGRHRPLPCLRPGRFGFGLQVLALPLSVSEPFPWKRPWLVSKAQETRGQQTISRRKLRREPQLSSGRAQAELGLSPRARTPGPPTPPANSPRGPSSVPGGVARGVPPTRLLLGGPPRTVRSRRWRGQGALPRGRAWSTSRARPWVAKVTAIEAKRPRAQVRERRAQATLELNTVQR